MIKQILTIAAALALSTGIAAASDGLKKLLTPAELTALDDITIVDIRDEDAYATGHIPEAVNAPYAKWRGPADNPGAVISDEALTTLLQGVGLEHGDRVVVAHSGVDQTDFGAAARVYWTLKSAGFTALAILNGGVRSWTAAGEPLSVEIASVTPSTESFKLSKTWLADADEVASIISGNTKGTLLDARPGAFFKGETKHPAAKTAGTLAGAKSFPFEGWFQGDPTLVAAGNADEVASRVDSEGEVVSFCNTGHWAATNWFALSELAGKDNVKLYPESMVGWVNGGHEAVNGQ